MDRLLLEIGCEEIPAGYIEPALQALRAALDRKLLELRISHGPGMTCGTPRRLTVMLHDVAPQQATVTTEVLGPPRSAAYSAKGEPTIAAFRFAEKVGVALDELRIRETPKGAYLCAAKTETGRPTADCLAESLPAVIAATPFPKTMHWGELHITFARPIHWILALLGSTPIRFRLGNITSDRFTFGHRFMAPARLDIAHSDDYLGTLRQAFVVADISERRQRIEVEIEAAAQAHNGQVLEDEELLDTVCNLVEYPTAVAGRFDAEFLKLPEEVLITAMREHQKYFAVVDQRQRLLPCFVTVNNTRARDPQLVEAGNARVLRARLNDARFFYQTDLARPLDAYAPALEGVLFQAKLGSMAAKVERLQKLSRWIAARAGCDDAQVQSAGRAAQLCKADLVTQMVGEFPKLQGIMGRVYALAAGEPEAVAAAIEEHYRPIRSGGPLPVTLPGAVVSLADKIDSICGCFHVGLIPTGASDPYALRRQTIGILQILQHFDLVLDVRQLLEVSLQTFTTPDAAAYESTLAAIYEFMQNRMANLLLDDNFSRDVVAAVTAGGIVPVPHVRRRAQALEQLKQAPDYESLAVAFKRVVNIMRKADGPASATVRPALFEHASETTLHQAVCDVEAVVTQHLQQVDFNAALHAMGRLRPFVDDFFDGVMVMSDDPALRANRLALLQQAARLFDTIADFSKLT